MLQPLIILQLVFLVMDCLQGLMLQMLYLDTRVTTRHEAVLPRSFEIHRIENGLLYYVGYTSFDGSRESEIPHCVRKCFGCHLPGFRCQRCVLKLNERIQRIKGLE
jgi:hypothetical protein